MDHQTSGVLPMALGPEDGPAAQWLQAQFASCQAGVPRNPAWRWQLDVSWTTVYVPVALLMTRHPEGLTENSIPQIPPVDHCCPIFCLWRAQSIFGQTNIKLVNYENSVNSIPMKYQILIKSLWLLVKSSLVQSHFQKNPGETSP